MNKILWVVLAGLLLGGCAAGPRFNPEELEIRQDMATVVFYRPSGWMGLLADYPIIANGIEVAKLGSATVATRKMEPGIYNFHSDFAMVIDKQLDVILDPGKVTYLRGTIHDRVFYQFTKITEVDAQQAIEEIADL